jgi:DNA (cytosine-5)-methyltransferase 1
MLNGLDLFSGIAGISLALKPWVRTVAYCESDRYAQSLLLSRMRTGEIDVAPIWDDVRTLRSNNFMSTALPDIIYGGFPCQDISVAGLGKGLEGERSSLVFQIFRLLEETRAPWVFLENVPAIRTRGAERVSKELASRGYDCRWTVVSAQEVGAPHIRKRWFLLATHADRLRELQSGRSVEESRQRAGDSGDSMADSVRDRGREGRTREAIRRRQSHTELSSRSMDHAHSRRQRVSEEEVRSGRDGSLNSSWWAIEPDVGRMADGIPHRVDRIRGLGNAVVPRQAREAFKRLSGLNSGECRDA